MAKEKFDIIQSTCIPIEIDNNNTDNIIPARYLAFTTRDPMILSSMAMLSCTTFAMMLTISQ